MIIHKINDLNIEDNVSCIGLFDGVHKGHQLLIKKTIEEAKRLNVKPYLITFDSIFLKGKQLLSLDKKLELIEQYGICDVILIDFNEDIMNLSSIEFSKIILEKLKLKTIITGNDFTYGKNKQGNINTLRKELNGINVINVNDVLYNNKKVSTTWIKEELKNKNYTLVDELLGYNHERIVSK